MTDYCYELFCINFVPGSHKNKFYPISPKVCRNCNNAYDQCANAKQYAQILVCPCTNAPFDLFICTAPDGQGNVTGSIQHIVPNCQYAGGIIGIY